MIYRMAQRYIPTSTGQHTNPKVNKQGARPGIERAFQSRKVE
ncbi:Uncharacterized protein APZ42_023381 [Daphnia magna]|uniref:Uncharacterized protein n=1 Tax=Daphnia magna TaxID=35525 RepID=A0A164UZY4_9CRUS|nr:Uncharacterized protein APZ42_023381 [Daphnia magna]